MNSGWVVIISVAYLGLLFGIAYWAERSQIARRLVANPLVYSLSLGIYCTAWAYYGSVGRAITNGIEFLATYLGPTITAPLWWVILRKIIRICKVQRIATLSDFVASRYGKSASLGALVALFCLIGTVPYISLQLKAISTSFAVLAQLPRQEDLTGNLTLYLAVGLGLFVILFGTRKIEATEQHEGMVTAIAAESLVKLLAFLLVGGYVTFGVFHGFGDVFSQAAKRPELSKLFVIDPNGGYATWFWHLLLSMLNILLLPRQFQVAVVENTDERHLNKAIWTFPLYMLVINLFVLPITLGGAILFQHQHINADNFVLEIPLFFDKEWLALITYLGGFSAATSMVIVETIALSTMLSNSVLMPMVLTSPSLRKRVERNLGHFLTRSRRVSILLLLVAAYLYYSKLAGRYPLVSIGQVSFTAVAQLAPAVLGGIFWKQGNRFGAAIGLICGFGVWFYTLVLPMLVEAGFFPISIEVEGPWGLSLLRPSSLFGLQGFDRISHALFWSLLVNVLSYVLLSIRLPQTSMEHNQAVLFVDIFKYSEVIESSTIWRGTAYILDLQTLLKQFFDEERINQLFERFADENQIDIKWQRASPQLVNYAENLLAGVVGSASARLMVASVTQEEKISVEEVVDILKESQQLIAVNEQLRQQRADLERATEQLRRANEQMLRNDRLKDDFLWTVTHELRTPITSIKALSEILYDNPDLDTEQREQFLSTITRESDRLTRLINQILDLEKYESGKQSLARENIRIDQVTQEALEAVHQLALDKRILITLTLPEHLPVVQADRDKLMQVFINLLSNGIKYTEKDKGLIQVSVQVEDELLRIKVADNGTGVGVDYQKLIFDKFYQAENQTIRKPKGSGLGLAITKKIIELHQGTIWVESQPGQGATFIILLPIQEPSRVSTLPEKIAHS
ncbi:MAG: ATP-binding protein [Siphonobacter sp.]